MVTPREYVQSRLNDKPFTIEAPRLRREIQLDIHRLEHVFRPSRHEMRELEKLRSMLKLLTGGRDV